MTTTEQRLKRNESAISRLQNDQLPKSEIVAILNTDANEIEALTKELSDLKVTRVAQDELLQVLREAKQHLIDKLTEAQKESNDLKFAAEHRTAKQVDDARTERNEFFHEVHSLRAQLTEANAREAVIAEAFLHWKGFYEESLAHATCNANNFEAEGDNCGQSYHEGKHAGLVSADIGLTHLKDAVKKASPNPLLLELEALRKDKERLDWLDKKRTEHIYPHFKFHPSNAASQKTWRTAIDTAIKEAGE